MKKDDFLNKLKKEGKIRLMEPSENIKQAYIEKSNSNLISSKILLENKRFEESVTFAYYSMYHILTALLYKAGIKSENHTASIIFLKGIFEIDNAEILSAKKERVDKQYYIDFIITKEQVEDTIKIAEAFNNRLLDFIDKVNNQDIKKYRERFTEMIE